jgi:putative copper export protein
VAPPIAAPATQSEPTTGAPSISVTSPIYDLIRWGTFASLLATMGALLFGLLVVPRASTAPTAEADQEIRGRLGRLARGYSIALLAFLVLRVAAQRAALGDVAPLGALLLHTTWGWGVLAQLAGALLAIFAATGRMPAMSWIAVLAMAVSPALSGHAVAAERLPALAIIADVVHVLAAAGWLGMLFAVALAVLPVARRAAGGGTVAARYVSAFSPLALVAASLLVLSGFLSALTHLTALGELTSTAYGKTLLIKLAVLLPVLLLGAYNWRVIRPRLNAQPAGAMDRLRVSSVAELVIGALVLAVTAVLVATPPPSSTHGDADSQASAAISGQ